MRPIDGQLGSQTVCLLVELALHRLQREASCNKLVERGLG
jgi:hypothetical protein